MKIYDEVKQILTENTNARNSDWALFKIVYLKRFIGLNGYPSWPELESVNLESYRRARQKVQENHPELQADEVVQGFRKDREHYKGTLPYHEDSTGQGTLV